MKNKAIECEWAVLGGILADNSYFAECDIDAADFMLQKHRVIFEAIADLINGGMTADFITVSDRLGKTCPHMSENWLADIGTIVNNTYATANTPSYAAMVKEEAVRRRALATAQNLAQKIQEHGVSAVDEAIRELMMLSSPRKDFSCSIRDAVTVAIDAVDSAFRAGGAVVGVTTGLIDLDACLGGLHKSDLVVIAARPSVGKTALLLNLADNADQSVGIISGEQGRGQVGLRLISKNGKLNAYKLRLGKVEDQDWPRITHGASVLSDKKMWIFDKPNPSIDDVMRQARQWKFQHDIKVLYLDYLQRIRVDFKAPRHEQVGYVALSLKELARELDIPVVALAQINRNVEERENKRPGMGDIKDSGSIEQEADIVVTLYRDEVYDENTEQRGIAELDVKKNRHGPTGLIRCLWMAETMTFENLATYRGAA
jgi:replicative DNA helicase